MQISVCVCVCLTCDSPYVRWNYRAISAELQQWGLLSVMWEGRLPPVGTELLAAAFLPFLSGGWRGIICQHAGSHCFGAGTNAARIRQLDCGRVRTVRLNPSYVYDYMWLFFTGMCTERPWPVKVRVCACERLYSRGAKLNRLRVDISLFITSTMTPKLKLSLATQSVIVMPITPNCWQQHPCQDVWRDCVQGSHTHKGSGKKTPNCHKMDVWKHTTAAVRMNAMRMLFSESLKLDVCSSFACQDGPRSLQSVDKSQSWIWRLSCHEAYLHLTKISLKLNTPNPQKQFLATGL